MKRIEKSSIIKESLDETMEMIKAKGIAVTRDVIRPNPPIQFFFVKDPNGVEFSLQKNSEKGSIYGKEGTKNHTTVLFG